MVNFEWIRRTFSPPIVATAIAISVVSGWGSKAAPVGDGAQGTVTVTASQYQQAGIYINEVCYSPTQSADVSTALLLYRLPLLSGDRGRNEPTVFHQQAGVAANYFTLTNAGCHQAMVSSRKSRTLRM
jgi:hypothetical protein